MMTQMLMGEYMPRKQKTPYGLKQCSHCGALLPDSCVGCLNCGEILNKRLLDLVKQKENQK